MRILITLLLLLGLLIGVAQAADAPAPAPTPAAPAAKAEAPKPPTPLEMYRNFEGQQAQLETAAGNLQAEFTRKMRDIQTAFDQCEGAKKLLLAQNPDLQKQLDAEAAKAAKAAATATPPPAK